ARASSFTRDVMRAPGNMTRSGDICLARLKRPRNRKRTSQERTIKSNQPAGFHLVLLPCLFRFSGLRTPSHSRTIMEQTTAVGTEGLSVPAEYQIDSTSAPYVEELLQEYLREPARLSAEWQGYF